MLDKLVIYYFKLSENAVSNAEIYRLMPRILQYYYWFKSDKS